MAFHELFAALQELVGALYAAGTVVDAEVVCWRGDPLDFAALPPPKVADAVDPRILVDRRWAEAILTAAAAQPTAMGPRMVAFYACIYYAAIRPAEVADLRASDIKLPPLVWSNKENREIESGEWGELLLSHSSPALSTAWTNAPVPD
ncbi:hypothetical protein [Actinopolymorpha pittospori]|uniref:Tyr recombinase domain-containing protein n=1 Tax=Actinopolymorpha pittospori TaxID=648752 RepID=A0A927R6V0_9ACTN|nr:hypothetical protein [Actinopolymorpha pittospori]MBE1604832.1 hypothetical protein [Actinopolymorpha pittospori]